jgi:excisionase family DNA binding protein
MTIKEASEYTTLSLSTIKKLVGEKKIAAIKIGRRIVLDREEIDNYFHSEEVTERTMERR